MNSESRHILWAVDRVKADAEILDKSVEHLYSLIESYQSGDKLDGWLGERHLDCLVSILDDIREDNEFMFDAARIMEAKAIIRNMDDMDWPDDDGGVGWLAKHLGVKPETAAAIMEDLTQ